MVLLFYLRSHRFGCTLSAVCFLFVLSIMGCGKKGIPTYEVHGTFKYRGTDETLPGTRVELRPENPIDQEHRVSTIGTVQEDGTILFTTFQSDDGAIEGKHQVMLIEPPLPEGWDMDTQGPPPRKIPRKYKSFASSGLIIDVTPDGENRLDIKIEKSVRR